MKVVHTIVALWAIIPAMGFQPLSCRGGKAQKLAFLAENTRIFGHGGGGGGYSQADLDNHADQMNPNNDAYWSSRDGDDYDEDDDDDYEYSQAELDNHADQMNPNNDAYWSSHDDDYECSQDELDNHADQMNPNNDAYWSSRE